MTGRSITRVVQVSLAGERAGASEQSGELFDFSIGRERDRSPTAPLAAPRPSVFRPVERLGVAIPNPDGNEHGGVGCQAIIPGGAIRHRRVAKDVADQDANSPRPSGIGDVKQQRAPNLFWCWWAVNRLFGFEGNG